MKKIIANMLRCDDGYWLHSKHRWDFVQHGETFLDGGDSYIRHSGNGTLMTVYDSDPHYLKRAVFFWGSYGKNGDKSRVEKALCDLTNDHIDNLVIYTEVHKEHYADHVRQIIKDEQQYRKDNGIMIVEIEDDE